MPTLYLITGPAGVGKSTISNAVAEKLSKSVLIEGDDIYHQVVGGYAAPWKDGNHLEIFWKVSVDILKDYLEAGCDVIFNYIIDEEDLEIFKKEIKDFKTKFVVLMIDEKTLLDRDAQRPEDCQMKERCIVLLNSFKKKNFEEKYIIDTGKLSVEESAEEIISDERFLL